MAIFSRAQKIYHEWHFRSCLDSLDTPALALPSHPTPRSIRVSWSPPPSVIKINFDGYVREGSGVVGIVLRDHLGNNVCSRSFNIGMSTPLIAEATALRNGLLLAQAHNISKVFIEGDNFLIINILQGKAQCPWKIQLLMKDVKKLIRNFTYVDSCHIYREGNRAAHFVASLGHFMQAHQDIDPFIDREYRSWWFCGLLYLWLFGGWWSRGSGTTEFVGCAVVVKAVAARLLCDVS
ncbi:uncharacterized protein LOC110689595 [Chenopodium quinoa]|uniref:uncharacterized protein LOC110689595 n=1 Tax=Chenopodium quinoa TaxID=63459 RepID=UPI000B76C294|nr:uncharacterized protein LOC110689595 [Chenopodium quinoa]